MFLSHQEKGAAAIGAELFRDIQQIFQDNSDGVIPTQMLIAELCKDEESTLVTHNNKWAYKFCFLIFVHQSCGILNFA